MTQQSTGRQFYPQSRTERLIAAGRMTLAAFFLLAIWLDPSEPSRYARFTYGILAGYLLYSLLLGAFTLRSHFTRRSAQVATHLIDLMVFTVIIFFTEGPTSPFFVFFTFLLVCATFRWRWHGTLWTAAASLAVVLTLAWYPSNLLADQNFDLNRFIIRIVYLAVVAILLGYLGAHEQSRRNVLCALAEWPRTVSDELQSMSSALLGHAAAILGAPRLLLIWEEEEEPWLHLARWSKEGSSYCREHPSSFGSLVAEPLCGTNFFCRDAGDPRFPVVQNSPEGLRKWQGAPLHPELQQRFAIGAVIASRLKAENLSGYLLVLDKHLMTADDLVLGGIVAQEISARLDHSLLIRQLQQAAASGERVRLARDLHDGLLQSLTGIALQLETAQRLMPSEPRTAQQRIQEIQRVLAAEQRDLRSHIRDLRPVLPDRLSEDFELAGRLEELAQRIRRQWDFSVTIDSQPSAPRISRSMAREIYFVVHEALITSVRHAGASALQADLHFEAGRVDITVSDDGHGFPFRGRYDQDALSEMKRGPVTLRERISSLGGTFSIDSRETGARLEISLPLTTPGG